MARDFGPNEIEHARKQIGAGKSFTGMGASDIAAALIDKIQCDAGQMPTLWQVRAHWQGPLLDSNVGSIFQPQTDILALGKSVPGVAPGGISVTQGLTNGELQTPSLICGVFVHVSGSPYTYTVPGAGWNKPVSGKASPVVPDTWTNLDVTGSPNPLGLTGGSPSADTFIRASMDYGRWAQQGLWAMCRAFNFVWSYGDKTTLLDWPLRYMAWLPPSAQNGSAGAGPVATIADISAMNTYYANTGGSSLIFLPRNARRTGSVTNGPVYSTFSPDDASRLVVPTVGGLSLREGLSMNQEVFMLPRPVLFPRGVSLGMFMNQKDATSFSEMQGAFSITNGLGLGPSPVTAVPPVYTPYSNINAGFGSNAGVTFNEQTKDSPPALVALNVRADETLFKWGDLFIAIGSIGYELTQDQYNTVVANQGDVGAVLGNAGCPCHIL